MGKGFTFAALLAMVAVAVVFLAPMIDLMPAPQAKQFAPLAVLLVAALLFPSIAILLDYHITLRRTVEIASPGSERLESICIHRC